MVWSFLSHVVHQPSLCKLLLFLSNSLSCQSLSWRFFQAAGALGSLIGNPADLALLRMQADGSLPLSQRRHYKYSSYLILISREIVQVCSTTSAFSAGNRIWPPNCKTCLGIISYFCSTSGLLGFQKIQSHVPLFFLRTYAMSCIICLSAGILFCDLSCFLLYVGCISD